MRIIFHLGSYKTGSSSFQNMLFENRDVLLENGILYPSTVVSEDPTLGHRHGPMVYRYLQGKHDVCPDDLLEELGETDADTVIFSAEAWSRPMHLSHLTRFVSILQDRGHHDCSGILVLRNLERYQLSNYREFTVNQVNAHPFRKYVRQHNAMFDYLLLARSFRSIFGSRFSALPFSGGSDITESLFSAIGIGDLYGQMAKAERANVKTLDALEVEAKRCANQLKKPKEEGVRALQSVLSENEAWGESNWTERFKGDTPDFTPSYLRSLRNTLDWSEGEIEALFSQTEPKGRSVRELSNKLIDKLKNP